MSILLSGIDMPTMERPVRTVNIYADGVVTDVNEEFLCHANPAPHSFDETISALLDATREIDIFALIGYGDAKVEMGFRASYWGELHNDPIIDNHVFMVAGDAYDNRTWKTIPTTRDLNDMPIEYICIRPRAICLWPNVEVDLGSYDVESMKVEAFTDVAFLSGYQTFPERIRLHIKRKD